MVQIPNNWRPRPDQLPLWEYLQDGGKQAVVVAHRRWGKDAVALNFTATQMIDKPGVYWHMLPKFDGARRAIWSAIDPRTGQKRIDQAFPKELRSKTREDSMTIEMCGSLWQVLGSDRPDSLVGAPPRGVVFSEFSLSNPETWGYIRPILRQNGGWAMFIYTPRGKNHGKTMLDIALEEEDWFGEVIRADQTPVFTDEQLEQEKRLLIKEKGYAQGLAHFNQEYMCSFVQAFLGKAVYPDFNRDRHVSKIPLLPLVQLGASNGRQIVRGWDNTGLSPACVITYINTLGQWYIVKEFCGDDQDIITFGEMVSLWCNMHFPGHTNYLDIGDPAGNTRDSTKQSPADYLLKHSQIRIKNGVQTFKVRQSSVTSRLNKDIKGEAGMLIDPVDCEVIIDGFAGGYCFPEISNSGIYLSEPKKNFYSHIHDAIQYPATILFKQGSRPPMQQQSHAIGSDRPLSNRRSQTMAIS